MVSGFKLDDYKKENPVSNKQDLSDSRRHPSWVYKTNNPVIIRLCDAIFSEFERLKKEITDGTNLQIKQRKIVKSQITKLVGIDKTNLSTKRSNDYSKVVKYMEDYNEELQQYWKKIHHSKRISGKKKTKDELLIENRKLKTDLKNLEQEKYHEYLHAYIDSNVLDSQKKLAKLNSNLKIRNQELLDENDILKIELRKARTQLSTLNKNTKNKDLRIPYVVK